jgi:hypothetical protein
MIVGVADPAVFAAAGPDPLIVAPGFKRLSG